MLYAKEQVSKALAEEIEAQRKKLEGELYTRVSVVMVALGADTYSAAAIEKAYGKEKRDGFPHQGTIDQIINDSVAAGDEDTGMDDADTPEEGNSDGGVPISPDQSSDANEASQHGVDTVVKGDDDADMDVETDEV
jgi:hypothetical protein